MRISNAHMRTHDIDWFCCLEGQYLCHFASNGSILPEFVADYDVLRSIQQLVAALPAFFSEEEVLIDEGYKRELQELEGYDEQRYFKSFKLFASKGFYSFDYDYLHSEEGRYRYVTGPSHPLDPHIIEEILNAGLPNIVREDNGMYEELVHQINR